MWLWCDVIDVIDVIVMWLWCDCGVMWLMWCDVIVLDMWYTSNPLMMNTVELAFIVRRAGLLWSQQVAVICPIIQVPHCIRVFFYFVRFVFINHIFPFYYELCTYCNILDIYLS